ncbi:MAG: class I SAM-dependent methyltransferase [Candidatus Margulisiibacteriota bacterium]
MAKRTLRNKTRISTLAPADFEKLFNDKLPRNIRSQIKKYGLKYREVTAKERDESIKRIVDALLDKGLAYSGQHRKKQWEKGWGQNLTEGSVIPHYFGKYPFIRVNQRFIRPVSRNFEYNMIGVVLDWVFDRYMKGTKNIYEFGCGTGHNLLRLRKVNPAANLWGLDWVFSSQKIIRKFARTSGDKKLFAYRFDYFNPDHNFVLAHDSIACTIASLEQVGSKYKKFVAYLLKNKPKLCINIEPIAELFDERNLLDYFALEYHKKRRYLDGYLTYLKKLEKQKKIKIHRIQRTCVGSFFNEGYQVVVWSPVK